MLYSNLQNICGLKMKKILLNNILILLLISCFTQIAYATEVKSTLAVMDFESIGSEEHLGRAVAEIIRTELVNTGQFVVLERSQLDKALSEQKLKKSGLIDDKSIINLGKLIGTNFIIIGSVLKIGTSYTINARMIDINTGAVSLGKSVSDNDLNHLTDLSHELLKSLVGANIKSKFSLIFEERFRDNIHGWYLFDDQDKRFDIVNGQYILESKRGGYWISSRNILLDQSSDFKIYMTIKKISGTDDYGFGMIWGGKNLNTYYIFVITGNGYFIHERTENGKAERILTGAHISINKGSGSSNILSLHKVGKNLEFYINNKFIGKTIFSPFFGDNLGCIIYSGNDKIAVGFTDIYVYGQ